MQKWRKGNRDDCTCDFFLYALSQLSLPIEGSFVPLVTPESKNAVKRTLHIHDHRDPQGTVTVQRLAVVSAVAASRYRHFQVEHVALHNGVGGSLAKPPEDRFRSRLRIALDSFRYRIHRHVDYLLRYRDLLRGDLRGKDQI